MRIAIPYTEGEINQHFGHSGQFKVYVVVNRELVDSYLLPVSGPGHEAAADLLTKAGVTAVLCGGIGTDAFLMLRECGILAYGGIKGSADKAMEDLLAGTLMYDENITCHNHDYEGGCGSCCSGCAGCGDDAEGCGGCAG